MKEEYLALHRENTGGFRLEMDPENKASREIEKFNILVPWYLHNALIHFAMPYGLEQYGGGAWGTRDVCQGPAELFTAFGRFDLIKKIILKVYERQFHETGDWRSGSCSTLSATSRRTAAMATSSSGPLSSRKLHAPYRRQGNSERSNSLHDPDRERVHPESIQGHVKDNWERSKPISSPELIFPVTGGGDWDDTLQPVRDELRTTMASSWTVALTIEALETFLSCDEEEDLPGIGGKHQKDYCKYFLKDGIPAGFVLNGRGGSAAHRPSERFDDRNQIPLAFVQPRHHFRDLSGRMHRILPGDHQSASPPS